MTDNNKLIIGLIGEIAAGKTTITKYLEEKHDVVSFRFSDMLSDMLDRIHVEKKRENLQSLSIFLREAYGEDFMSKVIALDVAKTDNPIIVVEGIRRPTDIIYLKKYPEFHLWAIDTEAQTRFERLTSRNEKPDDQKKTWEKFQKESTNESEAQITTVATQAEVHIDNNGSLEETFAQVEDLLKKYEN